MHKLSCIAALSLLGACGLAGQVMAADLPSRMSAPVAPAPVVATPPAFSWTGFYAGINGGYGWGGLPNYKKDLEPGQRVKTTANVMFGGQVGYNYQFGSWVVGAEADFDKLNGSVKGHDSEFGVSESYRREYMATGRARLGYAFDRLLVFGTAGIALEKTSLSLNDPDAESFGRLSKSAWSKGFVVGAGVEYALTDNVTAKGEYLYTKFGKQTYRLGDEKFVAEGRSGSVVRAGLNYKF
ncbi:MULTISPECIES: outer membrane protein [unclassified Chelatococcus]|uniref:outer membrane protein n=1 Tax=unclassified Chelatococcus TaxID=2638111 RepID=UPI001BCF860D|nr:MULTISPECIES: outer membrane protein [unclassified Chelatococcus]CAH1665121.1 31 kDa outer-membrane immunogenic protein [Hyphomicrobiales bacterium]MBS7737674.1 porin family protein [Chelatococcus sp. HY11]MBX3544192.1 porin family protein [Chelatococcus sp.]MCO5079486.1 porin family protein [Chelatococcus sp.]CAH1681513.1 31 kDa outer-membrane immunogenic protein [Hyphomicrobiales bacterium]